MPMFISSSIGCTGSLMGIFSGSLPVHPTASYYNYLGVDACTGSVIVSDYLSGSTTTQRVHAYLGDGSGASWTLLGGQPAAYQEQNTAAISRTMNTTIYRPNATIFISASSNTNDVQYTLPPLELGLRYRFISAANPGTGVGVTFTSPTTARLQVTAQCTDGSKSSNNKTNVIFADTKFKLGTFIECDSDGVNWYLKLRTPAAQDDVSYS